MRNNQIIYTARSLDTALDCLREEIIARLVKFVEDQGGAIGYDVIKVRQFVNGTPHEVTGIRADTHSIPRLLIRNEFTDIDSNIPLEEASTPVLTALLEALGK